MSDIEEALKRITAHQGVMGVAVFDDTGKLARYSLPQARLFFICFDVLVIVTKKEIDLMLINLNDSEILYCINESFKRITTLFRLFPF